MLRKTGIMFYGLLLLSVVRINGQNMFLMDSLKKQALSTSLSLSQQVNNLLVLSEEIQDLDSVQARKYAEEAMALAHGAGNDTLFADGLFREARLNISNLHFEVAKAQLDRELRLSQKAKYQSGTGRYDQGMGYLMIGHHEENDKDHKQIVDYFLSALKLFSKTNNHAEIAKCYLGLVKFYFDDQQGEKMDSTAQLAGKELTLCGDQRVMARYFQFIGKVYKFRSRAAKSYDFYRRALVCCIKIRDSVSIGYLKINLGNGLEQSGEDSLAIQSIREGITVLKSLERYKLKTVYANLALGHENLGEIYKKKKSKAECLDDFRKSIYYNTLAQKPYNEPLLLGNMGLAYVDFGMLDSALLVQNKALELRIKFHNKEGELFSYMSLGGIYLRKRDYRKAIDYEQKARVLSVLGFHAYDKDIYNILYNSYDSVKDYKNAF
ncbi:MAG TPA: tetratricopeptide repeat protein, partial [Bacteroidia bacterium]|nr:tetratricopeptide repeat protein [Bacteroidia bacterium]